jgi:signal peptidase I
MSFYYRRKLRKIGRGLLESSEKIVLYRRDVIAAKDLNEQLEMVELVRANIKLRPREVVETEALLNRFHAVLARNGGKIYPVSAGTDYTEMIIMAAIVAGAIRSFFLQPFKIPTNSMWPTYNGMTAEVRQPSDEIPGYAMRALQLSQWTWTQVVDAEFDGEIAIPIMEVESDHADGSRKFMPRSPNSVPGSGILGSGFFRSNENQYQLLIGPNIQTIPMPADFGFDGVLLRTFFPAEAKLLLRKQDADRWQEVFRRAAADNRIQRGPLGLMLLTGRKAHVGEPILNFDILTGDMLFVDRVSYHFVEPSRGDTFVFRTNNIPGLADQYGRPSQNYYVKRIAGVPGQRLMVNPQGQLLIDGKAPTSPEPVALNNRQAMDRGYFGYLPEAGGYRYAIPLNAEYTVTPGHFFAMGDNSANSYDSRGWGEVPAADVVGKPLFILHPFTSRWGAAK